MIEASPANTTEILTITFHVIRETPSITSNEPTSQPSCGNVTKTQSPFLGALHSPHKTLSLSLSLCHKRSVTHLYVVISTQYRRLTKRSANEDAPQNQEIDSFQSCACAASVMLVRKNKSTEGIDLFSLGSRGRIFYLREYVISGC